MAITDVNLDWQELDRALADVEQRGKRLGPAFRELRKPMRGDQGAHARGEEGPSGKWAPRSPMTEKRRLQRNRGVRQTKAMKTISLRKPTKRSTPKRLLGRLPSAVVYTVGSLFIRATSRAKFGGAHWKGTRVGRGVTLPQRMFLWLSDGLLESAREIMEAHVLKDWKK